MDADYQLQGDPVLYQIQSCTLVNGTRGKNGEAKPKPFFNMIGVASGRPLEVPTQLLGDLVKALPAISAKARL